MTGIFRNYPTHCQLTLPYRHVLERPGFQDEQVTALDLHHQAMRAQLHQRLFLYYQVPGAVDPQQVEARHAVEGVRLDRQEVTADYVQFYRFIAYGSGFQVDFLQKEAKIREMGATTCNKKGFVSFIETFQIVHACAA